MRRKLGMLILVGVTVLAGTQEAVRQFDGLRSTLNDLTRASLWSGLIVYAQPVADGKLPSPQIYYLMPRDTQRPASPAAQPEAVLADNNNNGNAAKPETKNNHTEEAADEGTDVLASAVAAAREVEDAAKSELVLLPQHAGAVVVAAAPKLEKARVYEEVARNEVAVRRFRQDADAVAKVFVKEFNAARIKAETERFIAAQEQLETLKLKALGDAERLHGQIENSRIELRVLRRAPHSEHLERLKAVSSLTEEHETALPAISGVACEKTVNTQEGLGLDAPAAIEAPATAPVPSVRGASEPLAEAEVSPVITLMGNNWALDCDTEPEFK
ncbi:MAG TPA: hypothetical protein VK363_08905 [Pyrinomonadaceae bacterium]|nr:hypothetical protein [Pyrinomonadaceae bacterium]